MWTLLTGFVVYCTVAFASEAIFTGITDHFARLRRGESADLSFPSRTNLWAIPVYGLSAAISFPMIAWFAPAFFDMPWPVRGIVYTVGIFAWEWLWGMISERLTGRCPWQYTESRSATLRYIKPSYAPIWFLFGFVLEFIHLHAIPVLAAL